MSVISTTITGIASACEERLVPHLIVYKYKDNRTPRHVLRLYGGPEGCTHIKIHIDAVKDYGAKVSDSRPDSVDGVIREQHFKFATVWLLGGALEQMRAFDRSMRDQEPTTTERIMPKLTVYHYADKRPPEHLLRVKGDDGCFASVQVCGTRVVKPRAPVKEVIEDEPRPDWDDPIKIEEFENVKVFLSDWAADAIKLIERERLGSIVIQSW